MGDSEAENINWYDSLSDEEDARKRAVSEDGGGQGGAEQGRCAESRPGGRTESTYRSRVGGGGAHHAVTAADAGHGFRARPRWPQLPLGHCQKQGAGTVKGAPKRGSEGKRRMSQAGPEKRRIKALCDPSPDSGKALPRPWSSMAAGTPSKQRARRGHGQPLPKPKLPSLHGRTRKLAHIHTEGRT